MNSDVCHTYQNHYRWILDHSYPWSHMDRSLSLHQLCSCCLYSKLYWKRNRNYGVQIEILPYIIFNFLQLNMRENLSFTARKFVICLTPMVCSHCPTQRPIQRLIKMGWIELCGGFLPAQRQKPTQIPIGSCVNILVSVSGSGSVFVSASGSVNTKINIVTLF